MSTITTKPNLLHRRSFVDTVLKGIGQIMLQENSITGLFFIVGICLGSLVMGASTLLATVVGTLTAILFNFGKEDTKKGLYGFSAALVGAAIMLFFKPVIISWIAVIAGAMLATIIQHYFIKKNIPVFTLPFVLVSWLIIYSIPLVAPDVLKAQESLTPDRIDTILFAVKGYGQVIFQASLWSGILFLIGVLISSWIAGLYGLIAALIAGALSIWLVPEEMTANGLTSYNAILSAIVFADKKFKNAVWALIAVILSVAVFLVMIESKIYALTFPFVAATCLTLLLKAKLNKNEE